MTVRAGGRAAGPPGAGPPTPLPQRPTGRSVHSTGSTQRRCAPPTGVSRGGGVRSHRTRRPGTGARHQCLVPDGRARLHPRPYPRVRGVQVETVQGRPPAAKGGGRPALPQTAGRSPPCPRAAECPALRTSTAYSPGGARTPGTAGICAPRTRGPRSSAFVAATEAPLGRGRDRPAPADRRRHTASRSARRADPETAQRSSGGPAGRSPAACGARRDGHRRGGHPGGLQHIGALRGCGAVAKHLRHDCLPRPGAE